MAKILIAGDYCPYARVTSIIESEEYATIFGKIAQYTSVADYSIVNLEVPIIDGKATPIRKCGPNLSASPKAIKAIKNAGFDMLTLANNHIYDFGEGGIATTLEVCKNEELDIIGGGKDIEEASKIFYKDIDGCKYAFINCCEHEFTIATKNQGGANPLNPIRQFHDINKAKKQADRIIVIVHGGHEHYQLPSPRMKETYRFFVDAGADIVVNHHQHCYTGYEKYNNGVIFYGIGNFCFDWNDKRNIPWNEGYMVMLNIDKDNISFDLIPYVQGNDEPGIIPMKDSASFFDNINEFNTIIADDNLLENKYTQYLETGKRFFDFCLEPYDHGIMSKLFFRGITPPLFPKKKVTLIENMVVCESHRDRLMYYLKQRRDND